MADAAPAQQRLRGRLVWDLPVRVFHWLLLLTLIGSWISAELGFDGADAHFWFGYTAIALVTFRIVWGVIGPRHARFASFVAGPRDVLQDLRHLSTRQPNRHVGHTPAGALMILLLLALVAVQAGTGLFIDDDLFYAGPLNPLVSGDTVDVLRKVHHVNFNVLQAAVVIHVLVIALYWLRKRQDLVRPMFTGRKPATQVAASEEISGSRLGVALLVALAAGVMVALLVAFAPDPVPLDFY